MPDTNAAPTAPLWQMTDERPTAFGGWTWTLIASDGSADKTVVWYPGDTRLLCTVPGIGLLPMQAARVDKDTGSAARAATRAFVDLLNQPED